MNDRLRVFACNSNRALATEICEVLGQQLGSLEISRFSNDNLHVQVQDNVRERDVFVIQSFTEPVSDHIMELLITLDALRSASARRVTAVIPYYSYARSDKKDAPRISITARLLADMLQTAGANRVLTMDLHADQVHGFFSAPVAPRPGLEPGTYGLTVPLSNSAPSRVIAGFAPDCCLIFCWVPPSATPRSCSFAHRISDSSRDLVRRHDPAPERLHIALGRGYRIVTTQDLDLLERMPAIHMSVAPSGCCTLAAA